MIEWGKSINQNTYGIKKLCEQLDETQCRHLIHLESFKVDSQWYQEFCQIFYPDRPLTDVSDKLVYPKSIYCDNCTSEYSLVELKKSEVLKLRWEVTNYLNVVEFVLIAWEGKVVDTEVIEQEFDFLIDRKNGKTLLEVFRMVAGDEETYPAIKAFCLNAARKKEDKLLKRTQVDQLDK